MKRINFICAALVIAVTTKNICQYDEKKLRIISIQGLAGFQEKEPLKEELEKDYQGKFHYKQIKFGNGKQLDAVEGIDFLAKTTYEQIMSDQNFFNPINKKILGPVLIFGNSQGALVARTFIQKYLDPDKDSRTVHTCILSMGALGGYYGLPDDKIYDQGVLCVSKALQEKCFPTNTNPLLIKSLEIIFACLGKFCYPKISCFCYSPSLQNGCCCETTPLKNGLSIANYWNDPNNQDSCCSLGGYKNSSLLAKLNNEIDHKDKSKFIRNATNVTKLLILESRNDPIVKPTKSAQFVTPSELLNNPQTTFTSSTMYTKDLLGLKQLYDNGKRTKKTFSDGIRDYIDPKDKKDSRIGTLDIASFSMNHDGQYNKDALSLILEAVKQYANDLGIKAKKKSSNDTLIEIDI